MQSQSKISTQTDESKAESAWYQGYLREIKRKNVQISEKLRKEVIDSYKPQNMNNRAIPIRQDYEKQ